ncbi:FimV/HubP family polar landmark protein [Thiocapsa roseopersicina]|uniref:Pilus assembly protein FimV n=1 Tax=Thiocapsa roseopersicina TaxID=1058 RepID=A0A1H2TW01_THIRO|nr:FimV/HubP family polar landmark protein [Thiocapsa roseopersicina]SDW47539.1 pilus assembly protein FimV [Thiocapsa roseopersicina]
MSRQVIPASIIVLALMGTDAFALGLGGLRTESALNQPFVGEIALFDVKSDELDTIRASLATADAFAKSGIERYHFLTQLAFKPEMSGRGDAVIRITSREPIREPFMDFLVEVVWPAGQLVKEFTVLLDPPSMSERPAPAVRPPAIADRRPATPPAPPRSAARADPAPPRSDAVDRPPSQPVSRIPGGADGFPAYFGPVRSGTGLLRLARGAQTAGATAAQTALALYRNNQDAFINGDIDRLIAGKTLVIPTRAELFALDETAAAAELQAALQGGTVRRTPITEVARIEDAAAAESARLRIAGAAAGAVSGTVPGTVEAAPAQAAVDTGPDSGSALSPGADLEQELLLVIEASESARQETEELRERVRDLETQLTDIQNLLQLRNAEVARLQGASGESVAIEVDSESSAEVPDPVVVETEIAAPEGSESIAEEIETAPGEEAPGVDPSVAEVEAEISPAAPASVEDEEIATPAETDTASTSTWHDYLLPLAGFAGVTALGVLAFSLLSARRRRREQEDNEDEWSIDSAVLDFPDHELQPEPATHEPDASERLSADAAARSRADASLAPPREPEPPTPEPAAQEPQIDSGLLTPSSQLASFGHFETETDEADALSEADIYIAYGRYKEAEELLKRELKRSPERLDVRFKLAEVYAGSENPDALRKLMQHLKAAGADTAEPARWQRLSAIAAVVEQGGTWDPGATMAITEATGVPATETGDQRHPSDGAADALFGEAREDDNDFFRLDLDEIESKPRPGPTPGPTSRSATPAPAAEVPSLPTEDEDLPLLFNDSALDSPPDLPELSGLLDLPESADPDERDRQADLLAEDDLILTLDDLRDSRDLDLDAFLDAGSPPANSFPAASSPAASAQSEPEASLSRLELPGDEAGLSQAKPDKPRSAPRQDVLESPGDALSDQWAMDSGIWDENATKLDLARAYMDMDDVASAREILQEVIADGREEQRSEAQDMLRTLA